MMRQSVLPTTAISARETDKRGLWCGPARSLMCTVIGTLGANGPLGRVAQCGKLVVYRDGVHRGKLVVYRDGVHRGKLVVYRDGVYRGKLVVYRDGVHRGAAHGQKSGAGGWAVGAGRFEQGRCGRNTRTGWGAVCSGDRHTTHSRPGGVVQCVVVIGTLHTAGQEVWCSV